MTPTILIFCATFKFPPIPVPPVMTSAPLVGELELSGLVKLTRPVAPNVDVCTTSVKKNVADSVSNASSSPLSLPKVKSTSDKFTNLDADPVCCDKTFIAPTCPSLA